MTIKCSVVSLNIECKIW